MNKNKLLLAAVLLLAGVSQNAQADFSWGVNFFAPFGFPVAGYFHASAPRPVPVYPVAPVIVPHVVHVAPVYHAPRPAMRYPHPRFHRRSMRGRVANFMRTGSWHIGVNFFA